MWKHQLSIFGLDLRNLRAVECFIEYVKLHFQKLHVIINNAAQTIQRPPVYYEHLIKQELQSIKNLPSSVQSLLKTFDKTENVQMIGNYHIIIIILPWYQIPSKKIL